MLARVLGHVFMTCAVRVGGRGVGEQGGRAASGQGGASACPPHLQHHHHRVCSPLLQHRQVALYAALVHQPRLPAAPPRESLSAHVDSMRLACRRAAAWGLDFHATLLTRAKLRKPAVAPRPCAAARAAGT